MARKKVVLIEADRIVEWDKPGRKVTGHYVGFKETTGKYGVTKLHVFKTEKDNVGCWGCYQLDQQLAGVERGAMTWVVFKGKNDISGGKTQKFFDTEWDDAMIDESIAGASITEAGPSEEQDEPQQEEEQEEQQDDTTPDTDEDSMEAGGEEEEEDSPPPAKRPAAGPAKKGTAPSASTLASKTSATQSLLSKSKR